MKKLLVCEDEEAIREFEVITLRRAGYEVVDASCGEEAIEYFDAAPNDWSVVLLDIMMPGIDGFTVCKSKGRDEQTNHTDRQQDAYYALFHHTFPLFCKNLLKRNIASAYRNLSVPISRIRHLATIDTTLL